MHSAIRFNCTMVLVLLTSPPPHAVRPAFFFLPLPRLVLSLPSICFVSLQPQTDAGETEGPRADAGLTEPPQWIKYDRKVLRFMTYFKEAVYERSDESYRVRCLNLNYFLEDGTLELHEPKQENSGVPQGMFLHRGLHVKSPGVPYTLDDFRVGSTVRLSNIEHMVYAVDRTTREWMAANHGVQMQANMKAPNDPFMTE